MSVEGEGGPDESRTGPSQTRGIVREMGVTMRDTQLGQLRSGFTGALESPEEMKRCARMGERRGQERTLYSNKPSGATEKHAGTRQRR